MDLPPCSLFIIQPNKVPFKFTSSKLNKAKSNSELRSPSIESPSKVDISSVLSIESLEAILVSIPKVELLPCGISAILNLKIHSNNSKAYNLFLIDLDEYNTHCQSCLNSNHKVKCLQGSKLLSHLYNQRQTPGLQNIVPLVMSNTWSPDKIQESLNLGAIDYYTKPLSINDSQSIWINVFRFISIKNPTMPKRLPSFNLAPVGLFKKPALSSGDCLEGVIVDYYTPHSTMLSRSSMDYTKFIRSPIKCQQLLRRIKRKEFNPYHLTESELITGCKLMFEDIFRQLRIPIISGRLEKFILITKSSYLDNDYHNFCHAVDVLQATYLFLNVMRLKNGNSSCSFSLLSPKHVATLLVAALGHDVGHPGVNNSFLIKTGIPIATIYSNVAVLEKFHALALINLIHTNDCNFFPDLFKDLSEFYNLLSQIIIATDMAAHFEHLKNIEELSERRKVNGYSFTERDCLIILSALIKCSDLINVTRPFEISENWTRCLTEEQHKQCHMELALGIEPLIPLEQLRGPQNSSQIGFLKNMALPLFNSTADLLPELELFSQQLQANLAHWQRRASSPCLESPKSPLESRPSSSLSPRQSRMTLVAGI